MARLARFTGAWLNEWRKGLGLTVEELAFLHGIPVGTMEDKIYDRRPPRLDTQRFVDATDYLLRLGVPPPGWPEHKRHLVRANKLDFTPENDKTPEIPGPVSAILTLIG